MSNSPYEPPYQTNSHHAPNRLWMGAVVFAGVWLITSAFMLVFSVHPQNPFAPFTTLLPPKTLPFAIVPYATLVATLWYMIPRSKHEFFNLFVFTGMAILGGLFGPHILTALAETVF